MAVNEIAVIFAISLKQLTIYSNGNMIGMAEKLIKVLSFTQSKPMNNDLRYTIFKTKYGHCGLLGDKNRVFRISLPRPDRKTSETYLLVGINAAKRDDMFMPELQNAVKSYFFGDFIDFSEYQSHFCNLTAENENHLWKISSFGRDILRACCKIPYGQTISYGQLAKSAGHPRAARAVGNIMGNNQLPIIIPCHRVIKADVTFGGFMQNSPGAQRLKTAMLKLEANELRNACGVLPKKISPLRSR